MLRGRSEVGLSGVPVPGEEIVDGASGMSIDARKDIGQPRERIDVVQFGRHDQRGNDGGAVGAPIGSGKQPRLATERETSERSFCCVVRKADPSVIKEAGEGRPALEQVVDRLGDGGRARQA